MSNQVEIKNKDEIALMRDAGRIVCEILDELGKMIAPGVSTWDLDQHAEALIYKKGSKPAFKGYLGFPSCLCASINEEPPPSSYMTEPMMKPGAGPCMTRPAGEKYALGGAPMSCIRLAATACGVSVTSAGAPFVVGGGLGDPVGGAVVETAGLVEIDGVGMSVSGLLSGARDDPRPTITTTIRITAARITSIAGSSNLTSKSSCRVVRRSRPSAMSTSTLSSVFDSSATAIISTTILGK